MKWRHAGSDRDKFRLLLVLLSITSSVKVHTNNYSKYVESRVSAHPCTQMHSKGNTGTESTIQTIETCRQFDFWCHFCLGSVFVFYSCTFPQCCHEFLVFLFQLFLVLWTVLGTEFLKMKNKCCIHAYIVKIVQWKQQKMHLLHKASNNVMEYRAIYYI